MKHGKFVVELHGERLTQRLCVAKRMTQLIGSLFIRLSEVNYPTKTCYREDGTKYTPTGPDDPKWRRVACVSSFDRI